MIYYVRGEARRGGVSMMEGPHRRWGGCNPTRRRRGPPNVETPTSQGLPRVIPEAVQTNPGEKPWDWPCKVSPRESSPVRLDPRGICNIRVHEAWREIHAHGIIVNITHTGILDRDALGENLAVLSYADSVTSSQWCQLARILAKHALVFHYNRYKVNYPIHATNLYTPASKNPRAPEMSPVNTRVISNNHHVY
jgi:hypothetical protein